MPEPSLEFSASCACGGDTSSILTTSNNHIRLERGDDCAVERSFRRESLDDGKVLGVMYLIHKVKRSMRGRERQCDPTHSCGLVLARSNKVGTIRRQLQVRHSSRMSSLVALNLLSRLGVKQRDLSAFMSSNDFVTERSERGDSRLRADRRELTDGLVRFYKSFQPEKVGP